MTTRHRFRQELLYLGRQVSYLVRRGVPLQDAIVRLERSVESSYGRSVDVLKRMVDGSTRGTGIPLPVGPYRTLERLMDVAAARGGDPLRLFTQFHKRFLAADREDLSRWQTTAGLLTYMVTVGLVATVCVAVYLIFVLPQFQEFFTDLGVQLPTMTAMVLGSARPIGALVFVSLVSAVLTGLILAASIRQSVVDVSPLNASLEKVPGLGKLVRLHNTTVTLSYLFLLLQSGVTSEGSAQGAAELIDTPLARQLDDLTTGRGSGRPMRGEPMRSLVLAQRLGSLAEELEYQIDAQATAYQATAHRIKEITVLAALILVGLIVGTLVIAMYLPIFQMGRIA